MRALALAVLLAATAAHALPPVVRALPMPARADPFTMTGGRLLTNAGGTGAAMDVAVLGSVLYLLDQDAEREDQLHALDRATGRVLSHVPLGKQGACAIATDGTSLWVLRRGRQNFLRQLDGHGTVLATLTPDELPPGKIYGLALDPQGFWFTAYDGERAHLYRLGRNEPRAREVTTVDGKILALTMAGGRLWASLENAEKYGSEWLAAFRPDGTLETKLKPVGRLPMGLDQDSGALVAMAQRGAEGLVLTLFPDPAHHRVLGPAAARHLRFAHRWESAPGVPVVVKQTHVMAQDLEFQRIRNFRTNAEVQRVTVDRDGNRWGELQVSGTGTLEIVQEMDVAEVPVAYTLDPDAAPPIESFPRDVLASNLGETSAFDFSQPAVQRLVAAVPRAPSLAGLYLGIHDVVADALTIVGPSGPETRASDFLSQGIGRCYAHTLAFAAVARGLGLPARAIGGIQLATASDFTEGSEAGVHTWNQAYFPGTGWVDIDSQADDDPAGHHSRAGVGRHVDDYLITFVGAYGRKDRQTQFAERSWLAAGWEGWSTDPSRKSGLDYKGLSVSVSDLPGW